MIKVKIKKLLTINIDKLLCFKQSLKLKIFKSSLSEDVSFLYKMHHINCQINFFWRSILLKKKFFKHKKEFQKKGYTLFSNKIIEYNSHKILEKIKSEDVFISKDASKSTTFEFKNEPTIEFKKELIEIFNNGIDQFIKETFNSDYCILNHFLYKSERTSKNQFPTESQLWHADGNPGIGMNLMICHTSINKDNGAMKIIDWKNSIDALTHLYFEYKQFLRYKNHLGTITDKNKAASRDIKCKILKDYIDKKSLKFFQPDSEKSGTVYVFNNNCVHAGGFTELGYKRIVSLFHIYPSKRNRTIEEKLKICQRKNYQGAFPKLDKVFHI